MLPPHWVFLWCFFSLPCFFSSSSAMVTSSFYSELIQWDFSLLPLGLHQLFLVCCRHPFRTTYQPIGCPDHCHYSEYVSCTITHFTTKFHFVCSCCIPLPRFKWIRIGLPHYLALWHASDGPNHLLLLLGKIPSQQGIFPKKVIDSWDHLMHAIELGSEVAQSLSI